MKLLDFLKLTSRERRSSPKGKSERNQREAALYLLVIRRTFAFKQRKKGVPEIEEALHSRGTVLR